jgi:hypothetical protein
VAFKATEAVVFGEGGGDGTWTGGVEDVPPPPPPQPARPRLPTPTLAASRQSSRTASRRLMGEGAGIDEVMKVGWTDDASKPGTCSSSDLRPDETGRKPGLRMKPSCRPGEQDRVSDLLATPLQSL